MPESLLTMQIYVFRHGITEDAGPGQDDAARALTDEGKKKLREVIRLAHHAEVAPDLILTSPYRRAVETAEIAAEGLNYREALSKTKVLVPESSPQEVWDEIRLHRDAKQVLLAGHQPNLGRVVAHLLNAPHLKIHLKRGALVRVDVTTFNALPDGELLWLVTPKLAR